MGSLFTNPTSKKDTKLRILCGWHSNTFARSLGADLNDVKPTLDEYWPAVLARSHPLIETFNGGVAGTTSSEFLARLPQNIKDYNPNAVIAYGLGNDDTANSQDVLTAVNSQSEVIFSGETRALERINVDTFIDIGGEQQEVESIDGVKVTLKNPFKHPLAIGQTVKMGREGNLKRIVELCRNSGINRVALAGDSYLNYFDRGDTLETERAGPDEQRVVMRNIAFQTGALHIDLLNIFRRFYEVGGVVDERGNDILNVEGDIGHVAVNNVHYNALGQRLMIGVPMIAAVHEHWLPEILQ